MNATTAATPIAPSTARAWLQAEDARVQRTLAELRAEVTGGRFDREPHTTIAGQHPADVASDTLEREIDFGLIDDFASALLEIDAARRRVAHGTYGTCERCGAPIALARMHALPATRCCRSCADRAGASRRPD